MRTLLAKVDSVPERVLLWINTALACLIGLAHGGALAITYAKPTPGAEGIRQLPSVSLPVAALIALTAAVALVQSDLRRVALAAHGWALVAAAAGTLVWAISLLVRGFPEGNFSWSPGLMSVLVCYSVFVASRYGVPSQVRGRPAFFYAPVAALGIALPIDLGVFVTVIGEMGERFG